MKTIKLTTLSVLLTFAVGTSIAKTSDLQIVQGSKAGLYKLVYTATKNSLVDIRVLDGDKNIITTKRVAATSGFLQPINFSQMPAGRYLVEIISKEGKIAAEVDHVLTTLKESDFDVKAADRKIAINTAKASEKLLHLYFFDQESTLLHQEVVSMEAINSKKYDLSAVNSTSVTMILAENGETVLQKKFNF